MSDENASAAELAERAFGEGFFRGAPGEAARSDRVRDEHARETPLRLAYALRAEGCDSEQVRSFALLMRTIGDREPVEPNAVLSARQNTELARLTGDGRQPASLRDVLRAGLARTAHRRDLYALIGIMLTTADEAAAIEATVALAAGTR